MKRYQNDWATAKKITTSIAAYTNKLGVSKEEAYALYQKHGTCLKGLLVEGRIDPGAGVEEFLREVHTIDSTSPPSTPCARCCPSSSAAETSSGPQATEEPERLS